MRKILGLSAIVLLAYVAIAMAQAPSSTADNPVGTLQLTPDQQSAISRGLRNEPEQASTAASQAQPGNRMPNAVTARPMPKDVGAQVPEAKAYLFVKLPDRVLLIDRESRMVAQIVIDTDGGNAFGPSGVSR